MTQKDGLTPMDVDRARARVTPPGVCLRCKKPGHYTRECPLSFDIRTMNVEEQLELLPELLALADLSGIGSAEIEEETEVVEALEEEEEGFRARSG